MSTTLPLTLTGSGGNATVDTGGSSVNFDASLIGAGGLTKFGNGTLVLAATNSYSGPTAVDGGLLSVMASLTSTGALSVGGGTFSYGPAPRGNRQTVAGLTVNAGASGVNVSIGNTLTVGAMTRNFGGGVDFNSNSSGTITTTSNANGILGPWATYGSGTSMAYATLSGSNSPYTIVAYAGATPITSGVTGLTDTTGTVNYMLSGGGGTLAAPVNANTIQFAGAGNTITASGANSLSLNGIMNDGSLTATISGGNLLIGSGRELIFTGPGNMTVNSVIQDNGTGASAVTVAVGGALTLTGSNTYSGGTNLCAGQLNVNNAAALGSGPLTISSGTVGNAGGTALTLSTTGAEAWNGDFTFAGSNDLNLGAANVALGGNRTLTVSSNTLTIGGNISGNYSLTKAGSGTLLLAGDNAYTGGTTVTNGTLEIAATIAIAPSSVLTIAGSGEVVLDDLVGAAAPSTAESESAPVELAAENASVSTGSTGNGLGGISTLLARIRAAQSARGEAAESPGGVVGAASPAAVPEPSAFVLLGVGTIGLLGYLWRRKRA